VADTRVAVDVRETSLSDPGGPAVEIVPRNVGAASILLRLETPTEIVLHLGQRSWWDRVSTDHAVVRAICTAVSEGRFTESVRVLFGRIVASHGRLELPEGVWHDRGRGLPLGRLVETIYEPFTARQRS
jgi:hypothetical protein